MRGRTIMRAIVFNLPWLFSIAILAFSAAASTAVPQHGAVAVVSAGAMHADGLNGCCEGSGQAKSTCCDPCRCNTCLADESIAPGPVIRAIVRTASIAMPSSTSIRPPLSPPRERA
jgi:hypothetical protein